MNWKLITATCAVAVLVLGAGVEAKDKAKGAAKDSSQPAASVGQNAPETISGEVVRVDHNSGMVTLRAPAGTIQEFKANKETLQDLKVGDKLEAKRRH